MPFVVEDGTGLEDATSLCDVAFADEYFADRMVTAWTGNDALKQSKLIAATDYVEARWSLKFKGTKQFPDTPQALSFPRLHIGHDGEVPRAVKKAVAEYALRALTGVSLAPDPTAESQGRAVASTKKIVGPIETDVTYSGSGAMSTNGGFRPFPMADALLWPYINASSGLVRY